MAGWRRRPAKAAWAIPDRAATAGSARAATAAVRDTAEWARARTAVRRIAGLRPARGFGGGYGQGYGSGSQGYGMRPGPQSQGGFGQGSYGQGQGGYGQGSQSGYQGGYGGMGQGGGMSQGYGSQRGQGRAPRAYRRSDERVREDLYERLSQGGVDASEVIVEVQEGRVTLRGTVPDRWMKHHIEDMADNISGVQDVENQIRVQRGGSSSARKAARDRRARPVRRAVAVRVRRWGSSGSSSSTHGGTSGSSSSGSSRGGTGSSGSGSSSGSWQQWQWQWQ